MKFGCLFFKAHPEDRLNGINYVPSTWKPSEKSQGILTSPKPDPGTKHLVGELGEPIFFTVLPVPPNLKVVRFSTDPHAFPEKCEGRKHVDTENLQFLREQTGWPLVGNEGINLYIGILGFIPTKGQLAKNPSSCFFFFSATVAWRLELFVDDDLKDRNYDHVFFSHFRIEVYTKIFSVYIYICIQK